MYSPQLPVGAPAPSYIPMAAPAVAPAGVAAPMQAPVAAQPVQAQSGGLMAMISSLFTGIINFFKRLFGGGGAASNSVAPTPALPGQPAAPAAPAAPGVAASPNGTVSLVGDDATIAKQYGIKNDPQNVANFKAAVTTAMNEPDSLGPGKNSPDATKELQQLLNQWGYNVQVSGQFDRATADAVMRFKATNGLTENFVFDNGDQGVVPFVDNRTKQKMSQLLQSGQAPNAGLDHVPGLAPPPPPPPPPPVAPPPPPPPAPVPAPPVAAPAPIAPPAAPAPSPAAPGIQSVAGLSQDQLNICQQAGIQATPDNFKAFATVASQIESEPGVLGPGLNNDAEAIRELQQVLAKFGYQVQQTGTFDQATITAVMQFKKDNAVTYAYTMADGSAGVNPYIDNLTRNALAKKLGG